MSFKRVKSDSGIVTVFSTESRGYASCNYCVTQYPEEFAPNGVWASVSYHSAQHKGHVDTVEISEEEYKKHLKFALRVLENQVNGTPLAPIITENLGAYDALNYDEYAKQQAG